MYNCLSKYASGAIIILVLFGLLACHMSLPYKPIYSVEELYGEYKGGSREFWGAFEVNNIQLLPNNLLVTYQQIKGGPLMIDTLYWELEDHRPPGGASGRIIIERKMDTINYDQFIRNTWHMKYNRYTICDGLQERYGVWKSKVRIRIMLSWTRVAKWYSKRI